jgi:hypothetical protein
MRILSILLLSTAAAHAGPSCDELKTELNRSLPVIEQRDPKAAELRVGDRRVEIDAEKLHAVQVQNWRDAWHVVEVGHERNCAFALGGIRSIR